MKNAPRRKPMAAGITLVKPSPSLIEIAGANKLQKLAAIITPPVNPSIPSKNPRFIFLKKKTTEAPKAVRNHVNVVASKAAQTGPISSKKTTKSSIVIYKTVDYYRCANLIILMYLNHFLV